MKNKSNLWNREFVIHISNAVNINNFESSLKSSIFQKMKESFPRYYNTLNVNFYQSSAIKEDISRLSNVKVALVEAANTWVNNYNSNAAPAVFQIGSKVITSSNSVKTNLDEDTFLKDFSFVYQVGINHNSQPTTYYMSGAICIYIIEESE